MAARNTFSLRLFYKSCFWWSIPLPRGLKSTNFSVGRIWRAKTFWTKCINLNQQIYPRFAPPRPRPAPEILTLAPPQRFWPLPCPGPAPKILTLAPPCRKKTLPCPSLIRLKNAGIVIGVENVLPKPLSWRCTNFATVLGRSHFYKKNCEFCEKLFPKPTSQMTHMFYSHRRKDLQTQDCDICGKYFTKTTVTMMHKFHHIEAKPSLEGELRVLWKIVPKTNLPDELHVY